MLRGQLCQARSLRPDPTFLNPKALAGSGLQGLHQKIHATRGSLRACRAKPALPPLRPDVL
jgi:hypothetical protein